MRGDYIFQTKLAIMDTIIGKGLISANRVIVYQSKIAKAFRRSCLKLSFSDADAYPFGCFPIMGPNREAQSRFFIGHACTTHRSLLQKAYLANQELLGNDWMRDPNYSEFRKFFIIQYAGRIWTSRKILVMRDDILSADTVRLAIDNLYKQGIRDINSYDMLFEDNQHFIHRCSIDEYLSDIIN
jgi:hypothetical protein